MHDTSDNRFLTGSEAARFLGVKPSTLYAYVSRGLIESVPSHNARERSYRLSDLIQLRQSVRGFKSGKDSEETSWTGPVIKSAITEICASGHCYRGHSALELALTQTPFEQVAELLWETDRSDWQALWKSVKPPVLPDRLSGAAAPDADGLELLKLLLVFAEMSDTVCRKLLPDESFFDTPRRLVATMACSLGLAAHRTGYVSTSQFPIAKTLLNALSGDSRSREQALLINSALVLCADHELNASALAARIAASCDASLYSCLLSALGTFSGTMHGAASRRAEDIVASSHRFKNVKSWLKDYLRHSESVPGFGTHLYAKGDPRAKLMLEAARHVSSSSKDLKRLLDMVDCVREELGLEPNLDMGLAAIAYALALPPGSGTTIFAVSRTVGWIAHAIEQRMYGGSIRPRARYIGRTTP